MTEELDRLSLDLGIEPFYWDVAGIRHEASSATKRKLLNALGYRVETETDCAMVREQRQRALWNQTFPRVVVQFENEQGVVVPLRLQDTDFAEDDLAFTLRAESGEIENGSTKIGGAPVVESFRAESRCWERRDVLLPLNPHPGYHVLTLQLGSRPLHHLVLIVAPSYCYLPEKLRAGSREWGIALQLASLRSADNWGIGDFSDLKQHLSELRKYGVDAIGLNPLHALFDRDAEQVSPYSPCSRVARNVLYVSIPEIPEFQQSERAQELFRSPQFCQRLREARTGDLIQFQLVSELKFEMFELLYQAFVENELKRKTSRSDSFFRFLEKAGASLKLFALHASLREHFLNEGSSCWGWPVWPTEYQNPNSDAVKEFSQTHRERIQFYEYLQFIAEEQFLQLAGAVSASGDSIGLYLDLALGSNGAGADAWAEQDRYVFSASMGAPPDELGPLGQNWGLPPFHPEKLVDACFEPFIQAIRYNMRGAGALRIDHMMSLFRLFWIPEGCEAKDGGYVRYPFEALLGIVALESQRNKCLVIGEDLGTVPDEVREGMRRVGILSYKVLYFMEEQQAFLPSHRYPREALVVTSTHDLPPLQSYWQGLDIELRNTLQLYARPELLGMLREKRTRDKQHLVECLRAEGLIAEDFLDSSGKLSKKGVLQIHEFLGRTPAMLQTVQLEDLLFQKEQVNVPGTVNEHPNWRRKCSMELGALLRCKHFQELAYALHGQGRGSFV